MEVEHLDHQHQREQYQHIFRLVEDRDPMVSYPMFPVDYAQDFF